MYDKDKVYVPVVRIERRFNLRTQVCRDTFSAAVANRVPGGCDCDTCLSVVHTFHKGTRSKNPSELTPTVCFPC